MLQNLELWLMNGEERSKIYSKLKILGFFCFVIVFFLKIDAEQQLIKEV